MNEDPYKSPSANRDADQCIDRIVATNMMSRVFGVHLGVCLCLTTGVIMSMLMMTPSGFAGVPWMVLVAVVFIVTSAIVAMFERSRSINVATVVTFWLSISVWHVLNLGSAPLPNQRLVEGFAYIASFGAIHGTLQWLLHFLTMCGRYMTKGSTPCNVAANKPLHAEPRAARF